MTNLLLLFEAPSLLVQVLLDGILVGSIFLFLNKKKFVCKKDCTKIGDNLKLGTYYRSSVGFCYFCVA